MLSSVSAHGLAGISRGVNGLRQASATIASAEAANGQQPLSERTHALVESKQHLNTVKVSARVIEAADRMHGSLIDTFA